MSGYFFVAYFVFALVQAIFLTRHITSKNEDTADVVSMVLVCTLAAPAITLILLFMGMTTLIDWTVKVGRR